MSSSLLVVHAVPVHRCAQLIGAITGVQPSVGFVHGMLKRAYTALSEVDARIRTLVTLAYAVCCDETPLRVGIKRMRKYLLVACTDMYTYYMVGDRSLTGRVTRPMGSRDAIIIVGRCTEEI